MDEISEPAKAKEEGGGGEAEAKAEEKAMMMGRKEKRKAMKKMKRKQTRKEIAAKQREEQQAMLNDPQELVKMRIMEQEEAERSERERKMFEERERAWVEALEVKKKEKQIEEEEEGRRTKEEEQLSRKEQVENVHDRNEVDDWEYVEEGPAEIIWLGNEIIVKKKRVKVPKRNTDQKSRKEDSDRPTSNPLPPQSKAFASSMSAQQLIENVSQQVPHFGTEQDKAHCPFHLKTGACRFGQRCSRVHFYPDKSSTLLIKNMYNGPGLAWEQDEVLECTDEEVDRCYEEFYEDVHTEFLKFGEIINFKVCRNGSFHLRGNVYIHYKSLDSAVHAHQSINGRYFAGKQISCEFINVTRWKVAICGEYMKSRYKSCSHGTTCNFIHCFRNPGGDYEWADSDRPPPKYWVKKMVALFGYSDACEKQMVEETFGYLRNSSKMSMTDSERYRLRRSRSRERDYSSSIGSGRRYDNENYVLEGTCRQRRTGDDKHQGTNLDEDPCTNLKHYHHRKRSKFDTESDGELLDRDGDMDRDKHHGRTRKSSRQRNSDHKNKTYETGSDGDLLDREQNIVTQHDCTRKSSSQQQKVGFLDDDGDYENKNREVDRDLSDREKDRDAYHDNRISSGLKSKVGYPDNHKDNKFQVRATDGEWSDSNRIGDKDRRRKTLRLSSKASKFIDHGNRTRSCSTEFSDDYLDKDAERHCSHARKRSKHWDEVSDISDDNRVPAQNLKHRGDDLSIAVRNVESPVKKPRSDENHDTHEPSSLGQYNERCRSHDSDSRCIYDVHIGEQDRWEPDNGSCEIYHNCKREAGSSESTESGRPGRCSGREESSDFDSELYYYDKIGREDRYESEKLSCSKHWKSRRKSTNNDWELENENRSLGSIQSSRTRRSYSLEEAANSSEDNKESGRKRKKHHVGHRSGDHKRHHKKN